MDQGNVIAHFVYRSVPSSRRHAVSLMLVARLHGSNVVAFVTPLGRGARPPVTTPVGRDELHVVGPWTATASRRFAKARVALSRQ